MQCYSNGTGTLLYRKKILLTTDKSEKIIWMPCKALKARNAALDTLSSPTPDVQASDDGRHTDPETCLLDPPNTNNCPSTSVHVGFVKVHACGFWVHASSCICMSHKGPESPQRQLASRQRNAKAIVCFQQISSWPSNWKLEHAAFDESTWLGCNFIFFGTCKRLKSNCASWLFTVVKMKQKKDKNWSFLLQSLTMSNFETPAQKVDWWSNHKHANAFFVRIKWCEPKHELWNLFGGRFESELQNCKKRKRTWQCDQIGRRSNCQSFPLLGWLSCICQCDADFFKNSKGWQQSAWQPPNWFEVAISVHVQHAVFEDSSSFQWCKSAMLQCIAPSIDHEHAMVLIGQQGPPCDSLFLIASFLLFGHFFQCIDNPSLWDSTILKSNDVFQSLLRLMQCETFSFCAVLHNLWPKDQLCKHQWWIWWSIDFRMHPFLLTKSIRLSESSAKGTTCFEHPFLPLVQTRSMRSHTCCPIFVAITKMQASWRQAHNKNTDEGMLNNHRNWRRISFLICCIPTWTFDHSSCVFAIKNNQLGKEIVCTILATIWPHGHFEWQNINWLTNWIQKRDKLWQKCMKWVMSWANQISFFSKMLAQQINK